MMQSLIRAQNFKAGKECSKAEGDGFTLQISMILEF